MGVIHKKDTAAAANDNVLEKIAELNNGMKHEAETQLIQLRAQAEIYEQLQEYMLILFKAVAEIYEAMGGEQDG